MNFMLSFFNFDILTYLYTHNVNLVSQSNDSSLCLCQVYIYDETEYDEL